MKTLSPPPRPAPVARLAGRVTLPLFITAWLTGCGGSGSAADPSSSPQPSSTYAVSLQIAGQGSVQATPSGLSCTSTTASGATCSGTVAAGSTYQLQATPQSGYSFTGWGGACSGTSTCSVTVSSAVSVTANFTATSTDAWPPEPQLRANANGCASAITGSNRTFNVGPGQTYTELTDVPWLQLTAGDVVNIHYRATPYRTKFGLRAQGTAAAPVVINGVTDANCNRPEISGDGAVTANDIKSTGFGVAAGIEPLGLILIHRLPTDPDSTFKARHITFSNLKLTNAHYSKRFTNAAGSSVAWDRFSPAIYAIKVDHLTIENCEITGNGQGVFVNSRGGSEIDFSSYVTLRHNKVHLNGTGESTEHNLYIQAYRTLYEGNYVGAVAGGAGSAIKDRSSGTVVRYNHIVSGARALDLVETEEEYYKIVQNDPLYHHAWVYGNLIVNDVANASYSGRLIHWGYDNTLARARTGTLYFYNNTLVNRSTQSQAWYVTLFHMNPEIPASANVLATSNVFANYGTTEFQFITEAGKVNLRGTNFVPTGWTVGQPGVAGTVDTTGATLLSAADPGLASTDYRPQSGSITLDRGVATPPSYPTGVTSANLSVKHELVPGSTGWITRTVRGAAIDLGALEGP